MQEDELVSDKNCGDLTSSRGSTLNFLFAKVLPLILKWTEMAGNFQSRKLEEKFPLQNLFHLMYGRLELIN